MKNDRSGSAHALAALALLVLLPAVPAVADSSRTRKASESGSMPRESTVPTPK